MRAADW